VWKVGWVRVFVELSVLGLVMRYAGVECRDDGLLAAVGGRGGLIRTGWARCGARDQPAGLARRSEGQACDKITPALA